jgi:predicted metal-dependent HD superfamily phosphohydrolase
MNLQEKYTDLFSRIGFNANEIETLWLDLEKAYSGKSRHYHNLNHLKEMIELFDEYQNRLKNPDEVLFSIFYHDYIYKATRKDNELKSAEYALKLETHSSASLLNKNLIFDAICATQSHQQNDIEDINWLIDFDLKILAKDWDDYQIYFNQIRKEYRIYPDFLYNPGRKKALEHFLENEFIFQTEEFRRLFEEKARINIEKEISLLA